MASQDNKSFVDTLVDAQKQTMDAVVENTKKFTNGNNLVNETIQKGSDWYKNWLESQKNIFNQASNKAANATETVKDNASKLTGFYENWFNTQMNWAKQMWEMNTAWVNDAIAKASTDATNSNPMNMFNNWMGTWNNWANNMNHGANWMNQAQQWQNQWKNMFNTETWKDAASNWNGLFNQYHEVMNNTFAEWQKNFQTGTVQDAYRNMVNVTDGFSRFAEMWTPMWKSIQEKTFNTDLYKQWMNPSMYKDLMDKYFGFMPENSRHYMQQIADMMNNGAKQFSQAGMNNYQQMRGMMNSMMPMTSADMFGNMLNTYNTWYGMMNNAFAPLTKMMTPNQYTKSMMEWNDISNRIMVYNIKNAELQYMIYNQGSKVMDKLAENVAAKMEKNEEINSMMALYQEWLNISDKVFVSLFESEEYGKLMAEVSAMQLKLRKDIEAQMEKFMVGIPVATRSEMDELYKTIYDLKKQVRELEKAMENGSEEVSEEKAARKATAAKK